MPGYNRALITGAVTFNVHIEVPFTDRELVVSGPQGLVELLNQRMIAAIASEAERQIDLSKVNVQFLKEVS